MYKKSKTKLTFCILLMIFGVVIVPMLYKYWDQPIIEKSKREIPVLKKNTIIQNNSFIMEILLQNNLTIDNKNSSKRLDLTNFGPNLMKQMKYA